MIIIIITIGWVTWCKITKHSTNISVLLFYFWFIVGRYGIRIDKRQKPRWRVPLTKRQVVWLFENVLSTCKEGIEKYPGLAPNAAFKGYWPVGWHPETANVKCIECVSADTIYSIWGWEGSWENMPSGHYQSRSPIFFSYHTNHSVHPWQRSHLFLWNVASRLSQRESR